ncbi:Ig-like domain-containing protein [Aliifodinibius sp. S!AR15-10]|uniref:cohesin domain-containing protein n=1 Tax=Aliifodinibius sp. S!AR15-10 TaxID=2950437 RepID=UPI0028602A6F|nr:cohesin domain-containing protein [Aliifodinibius sp. S!AR15-10]MDR8390925.1 Ig-like domain-containing protein [Aliifodinibius sp. S!AR15-10]
MISRILSVLLIILGLGVSSALSQAVTVSVPDTAVDAGTIVELPITTSAIAKTDGILSGEWTFTLSSDVVELQGVETAGTLLAGQSTQFNTTTGKFAFTTPDTLQGSGVLLVLKVKVNAEALKFEESTISVVDMQLNEGQPVVNSQEGTVSVRGIALSPRKPYDPLVEGNTVQFNLDGNITTPVTWSSSDEAVATVSASGEVQGVASGSVRIYAEDATGLKDSTEIFRVEPANLLELSVHVSDASVYQTLEDTVQVMVSDISGLDITSGQFDLTYSSEKIEILSLDTEGTLLEGRPSPTIFEQDNGISVAFADSEPLTGQGALLNIRFRVFRESTGSAYVTPENVFFNENFNASVQPGTVQIIDAPVLEVDPPGLDITKGESQSFSILSGGTAPYSWSIGDTTIASIDAGTGQLQALKRGVTSVTATDSDNFSSESISVTVNDVTVSIPDVEILDDGTVTVPIQTMDLTGLGVLAYEMEVEYDTTIATFQEMEVTGTLSEGFNVFGSDKDGVVKVAMASTSTMSGAGDIVRLKFSAAAGAGDAQSTPLTLRKMQFNEPGPSSPTATRESGAITIKKTSAPEQVVLQSPVNGAADLDTTTTLTWNFADGADSYELILSKNQDLSTPLAQETDLTGTSFDYSSGFEHGTTYYWRVRGTSTGGNGAWSETWSFTTLTKNYSFSLNYPEDNATGLSGYILFSWDDIPDATEYNLTVATDAEFTNVVVDSAITYEQIELGDFASSTTHYWKVTTSIGGQTVESEVRSFTTQMASAGTPQLTTPGDGSTGVETEVALNWNSVEYADSYRVELATSSDFSFGVSTQTVSATSATFTALDFETTYFWRVTATNSLGDGGTSNVFSFTTRSESQLASPTLTSPTDGTETSTSVLFSWNSVSGATGYRLLVATDSEFNSITVDNSSIETQLEVSTFDYSTTYYWKVVASDGSKSSESEVRSFTTYSGLAAAPVLESPADGATDVATEVTLRWSVAELADTYRVELSTDSNFGSSVQSKTVSATEASFSGLDFSTTYHWRVTSINSQGDGGTSQAFGFTTAGQVPGPPLLELPADNVSDLEPPVEFFWNQALGEGDINASYRVQVATDSLFSDLVANELTSDLTTTVDNFLSESIHFWRVRGENSSGNGEWSEVRSFSISFFAPPTEVTAQVTRSFGASASPQDYRMVALPGQVSESLSDLLNGQAGVDWQAYWDNGNQTDYMVKYDGSSSFRMKTGNGFWVTSQQSFEYNQTISAVQLNSEKQAVIPLHQGWNIISNPLDIDVSWSSVASANGGGIQPVWRFDGLFSEMSFFPSAKGGEAFYFLNDHGLEELVIPYEQAPNKERTKEPEKEIRLTTLVNGEETSSAAVSFSKEGKPSVDIVAPPGDFEDATIRFMAENIVQGRTAALARIHRSIDPQGQSFEMKLRATPGKSINIALGEGSSSALTNIVLIDKATGKSYDLSASSEIQFNPQKEVTPFTLVMGSTEYLEEKQRQYLPKQVEVMPNYPNPFNPNTTLRFSLPQQSHVNVKVYDVVGRNVATLVNGVRPAGKYQLQFDASNHASGMYFAVFEIGSMRYVQKMLLIK